LAEDAPFLGTDVYKAALEVFSGKRFGCPNVGITRMLLQPFLSQPASGFFKEGSALAKQFEKLKKDTKSTFKSVNAKNDVWTKPYLAPRMALLLSLRHHLRVEEKNAEAAAASAQGGRQR